LILESLPKINDTNISLHPITDKAFVSSLHSDHYRKFKVSPSQGKPKLPGGVDNAGRSEGEIVIEKF